MLKEMPKAIESEKIVLSAILNNNDCILNVLDILKEEDFYNTNHKLLYKTFLKMFKNDIEIEIQSLVQFLGKENVQRIGGISYLSEVLSNELTSNYRYHAEVVKEKSMRRNLINACDKASNLAREDNTKANLILNTLQADLVNTDTKKSKTFNIQDLMSITLENIETNYKNGGEICGIKTGFTTLDRATNGYQRGDLWTIAARPSMGKTLLTLNLLSRLPKNFKGMLFELEMIETKIGTRLLAAQSKIQSKLLARGNINESDFSKILNNASYMSNKNNLFVNCQSAVDLAYIRSEAYKTKIQNGLDVIFVDHIGLMRGSTAARRDLEISEYTSGLKAIAKDLDICVVCLSQLSRAVEQRTDKRPLLADLRDSGSIEQDSDVVIMLYRDDYYADRENRESANKNVLELCIQKNRDGEVGNLEFYCDLENQFIGEVQR